MQMPHNRGFAAEGERYQGMPLFTFLREDTNMSKKISIATGQIQKKYGDKEAIRIAKEIGADAIDFSLDDFSGRLDVGNPESVYARSDEEIVAYFKELKDYADELGIEIGQTHGRGAGYKNIKEEDERLLENARIDCLATSVLGAPVCVIHAVTTMFHMDAEAEFMHDLNFDMFNSMIPFAKQYGIKIATETFGDVHGGACCDFFGNIDEFIKSYERICSVGDNAEYLTVCMDTGHTNKATKFNNNPLVPEAIRLLGNRITVLHLNDNDTSGDQHLIPFTGTDGWPIKNTIDWADTFAALEEIGYSGIYNLELELKRYGEEIIVDTAAFALKVLKNALK